MKTFSRGLLVAIFIFLIIFFGYRFRKIYLFLIECKNSSEIVLRQEKIRKHNNYIDADINGIVIDDFIAIRRTFYFFQWKEIVGNKTVVYKKVWSDKFIDSSGFYDRTKQNINNIPSHKNKLVLSDMITKNNIFINEKYFNVKNKISFEAADIRASSIKKIFLKENVSVKSIENDDTIQNDSEKNPDKHSQHELKIININEKFVLAGKNVLVNSKDIDNPQIGDVKVVYEKFSPSYVIFLGLINRNRYEPFLGKNIIMFNNFFVQNLDTIFKLIPIIAALIYINFSMFAINFILLFLKKDFKKFSLKCIPYFNEYIVYGNGKLQLVLFSAVLFSMILGLEIVAVLIFVLLIYLRKIDYYSI